MLPKNIDLRLLICLDTLLRESSVTAAAERLQMSQGNMSNSLARLRELTGDPLLVRTARGMIATEHARYIWPRVQQVIRELTAVLETSEQRDIAQVHRTLRIACADATALVTLSPVLAELRDVAPNLQFEVSQINNFQMKDPLGDGSIDLAIGAYPHLSETLQISRLISGRMKCGLAQHGNLAPEALTLDAYCAAKHGLLTVATGLSTTMEMTTDHALVALGRERQIRLRSQYATLIADAAARGGLLLTLPDFLLRHFAGYLPLAIVDPPFDLPPFALSAVWHVRGKDDWVLSWLRQRLRLHLLSAQGASDGVDQT